MRQNPMLSSRMQVGGRQMPAWFSTTMVNPPRATMSTPPPLPVEPPPTTDESEYEEIDHLPRQIGPRRGRSRRVCNLCGNSNAVVVCEMCDSQIFCGGCNDMYHRHPKRLHHVRQLIDAGDSRPPLPPKVLHNSVPQSEVSSQVVSSLPPVPPPRRNKRFPFMGMGMRSATSSPTLTRKTFDPMGTLKRFVGGMGQRPLPPPPHASPPLPPKPTDFGRPMTPVMRGQNAPGFDRRHSSPAPSTMQILPMDRRHVPQTVLEYPGARNQSVSIANLNMQRPPSRNNGYPEWEEDHFTRGRAQSVSVSNSRFPNSSQDASHFATLQRPRRAPNQPPERPPPPLPPRSYPSQTQLGFQSSQSAFNINQMGMSPHQFGGGMPWNYPGGPGPTGYPMDFQQAAMMGYPGTMRRTPSNQSMGGVPQQFFGWGPMGFGPPMTQQEMELELLARRGSDSMWTGQPPPPPRPPSVSQSQPVTPQGSFRRKNRPSLQNEQQRHPEVNMMDDRFVQNQNQRPSTPKGLLSRMNPSPIHFQETIRDLEEDAALEFVNSDEPEGPWTCPHCTFINPKSTKICTICCKTPEGGYRSIVMGKLSGQPEVYRKGSHSSTTENEDIPVIESKLSISRGEKQQTTINLIESVQRVRSPTIDKRSSGLPVASNYHSHQEEEEDDDADEHELINQAQHHQIKINTKKPKIISAKAKMNDSNEDVYGSVPVQAITISPKIEIQRHPPKTATTGAGSSSPKAPQQKATDHKPSPVKKKAVDQPSEAVSTKPISKNSNESARGKSNKSNSNNSSGSSRNSYSTSSSSSKSSSIKKPILSKTMANSSPSSKQTTVSVSNTQVQADNGESSSESNPGGGRSSSQSSEIVSSNGSEKHNETNCSKLERKRSKGTSPPPQSISTQTYEELPSSTLRQNVMSKTSMQSLQSDDFVLPKPIEMSEKALRYARKAKAKHHHETKLKRSLSQHLYSVSDPWMDDVDAHGRNLYRSSSRHSLMSDTRSLPLSGPPSRDISPPRGGRFFEDLREFRPPSWDRFPTPEDYFASLEDLVSRRRKKDSHRSQDFELSRLLKEAEDFNYTSDDVQVALKMCGERNPVKWLQENWLSMIETVQTLATKYGREKGENNQTGTISSTEAKNALRANRGNVWAAVTECIEQRRKKFLELQSRGTFFSEDILTALTANHGNLDAAYVELSKAQLKPFLMRIWGSPSGLENDAVPSASVISGLQSENFTGPGSGSSVPTLHQEDVQKPQQISNTKTTNSDPITPHLNNENVALDKLEAEPRLELLVSNAEKVSHEIEKAIQELKQTKHAPVESNHILISQSDKQASLLTTNENEPQIVSVKSDEEENFVDAVSASDSEIPTNAPLQDSDNAALLEEEFYDDDILQTEIDDTEAIISEFIQNYEVVDITPISGGDLSNEHLEEGKALNDTTKIILENILPAPPTEPFIPTQITQETAREDIPEASLDNNSKSSTQVQGTQISSTELEQLLSTLTTTFTEMGQFATDIKTGIKAQIASEIQQQLAAASSAAAVGAGNVMTTQKDESLGNVETTDTDERIYEPIILSESISQSVDKKIAKYKRLAAKKDSKTSARHKSPDVRKSKIKEKSRSPSPGSSLSEGLAPSTSEPGLGLSEEDLATNISDSSSPFPNSAQVEIVALDNDAAFESQSQQDVQEDLLSRDEGEYNSGPDDSDSEEISEEDIEESEEGSSGSEEDEIEDQRDLNPRSRSTGSAGSSEDDEERQLIEGAYEEIDVNHSSDFEIYNNKDTEKSQTIVENEHVKHFVPSVLENTEAIERENSPVLDLEIVTKSEKERRIERLMTEGKVETGEKAELAVQLIDMNFTEEDSVYAANECFSLCSALSFLQQECYLCTGRFSARQMVSMLRCTHVCCHTCAKEYFTVQIRDKTIVDATCPFCGEPSNLTDDPEGAADYFNHLDILLKSILEPKHHEMFQRKLRDWALNKTPNFKWCSKCSSGFITEPLQTRLICPDCNAVTCAICLEQWDKSNHNHRESKVKVCDSSSKTIVDYLNENSIECPRCHFRFSLARGGCMHLTCTQCRHDFCSGCSASFRNGDKCDAKLPVCERLGLHAHHPRNCLFYLRDKEPEILSKLLEDNAIPYLKENSGSSNLTASKRTCQVPIQKETSDGLKDDHCGKDAPEGYATVCKGHYVEYLGLLVWQNHLDPISILSSDDLEVIIRRANKKHPGRPFSQSDEEFRNRLLKVIQEEIPL